MAKTVVQKIFDELKATLEAYVVPGELLPMFASVHRDGEDERTVKWEELPKAVIMDSEELEDELTDAPHGLEMKKRAVVITVYYGEPPAGFDNLSDYRLHLQAWTAAAVMQDKTRGGNANRTANVSTSEYLTDSTGEYSGKPYFEHTLDVWYRIKEGDPLTAA